MARNTGRRQQNRPAADWNHFYVYGSAVRQPEALPSGNETVREKAMNEMGMVYESQGKVIHYQSPTSDYVKQYDNIPEDGVLAQSKDVKNKE